MLLHLVMIAWMVPMVSADANSHCEKAFPGSFMLLDGVDLSTFDMNNRRHKKPVIDATCKQGTKKHLGETEYALPDQVANWYLHNSRSLTEVTRIIETVSDVRNMFNAGVTVEGRYGAVSGWASVGYKEMQRTIAENEYFYSIIETKIKTGTMDLKTQLPISEEAKHFLSSIDKPFKEAPEPYLKFIKKYGTHYFSSGSFGGAARAEFKIKSSLKKKYSRRDLAVQTKIAFNHYFDDASMKPSEDFQSGEPLSEIIYRGGNHNMTHLNLKEWLPNVLENHALLSGNLSPISDLLKDQPKVQEQLVLAVDSYYAKFCDLPKLIGNCRAAIPR